MATTRTLTAIVAAVASLALSCLVFVNALHFWRFTDAAFIAHLRSESYMDILGFGFWPTWTVTATLQALCVGLAWAVLRQAKVKLAVPLLLALFLAASVFDYQQVARIDRLLGSTSEPK